MDPNLSIIVPVYNVENYLAQCVDSIINQPYNDFELILVDDGSTDKCGEICDSYAESDKRIKVIHKENGGLSSARNVGLDIAKGKYLSFIDSDDFISEDYYQQNIQFMLSNSKIDILVSQFCRFDNNNNSVVFNKKRLLQKKADIVSYMMSTEYIGSAWINIYKKNIFLNVRYPEGKIFEDGYILTEIVDKANCVYISDIGIYYYRMRKDSIMGSKKSQKYWCDILETHNKQLDYCYTISDNKKLFLGKYKICHLALIYAFIEYPDGPFQKYINKFQSYEYNILQLLRVDASFKEILKLYMLKKIGFKRMISFYKLLNIYKRKL